MRAMPERAEPSRAVNSDTPKSLKKKAVIQSMSGGFSSHGWRFQWGIKKPLESISREIWA